MRFLRRLFGSGELERELEHVREAQNETGVKLEEAQRANQVAESRLAVVEARVGIATRRP